MPHPSHSCDISSGLLKYTPAPIPHPSPHVTNLPCLISSLLSLVHRAVIGKIQIYLKSLEQSLHFVLYSAFYFLMS